MSQPALPGRKPAETRRVLDTGGQQAVILRKAGSHAPAGMTGLVQWHERWANYLFKIKDWRRIQPGLLVSLSREKNVEERTRILKSLAIPSQRFDLIEACANMKVSVRGNDGRVRKRKLPKEARDEFLRGARVFLALRKLDKTPDGKYCDLHFIEKISEAVITYWWTASGQQRTGLFTEVMPALIEQPGYRLHPEHVGLAGKVARILFLTLYNSMFGKDDWVCPCGAQHSNFGLKIPPTIAPGAIGELPDIIERLGNMEVIKDPENMRPLKKEDTVKIALVCDDNTRRIIGARIREMLELVPLDQERLDRALKAIGRITTAVKRSLRRVVAANNPDLKEQTDKMLRRLALEATGSHRYEVIDCTGNLCEQDEAAFLRIMMNTLKVHVVISVGGGTPNDVAKLAASKLGLPFISIPSALSHDGAASRTASLKKGADEKHSLRATAPVTVIIDLDAVRNAPDRMTGAGFGDALKFTEALSAQEAWEQGAFGPNDGRLFTGPEYCPFIGSLLVEISYNLLISARELKDKTGDALVRLARYLIANAYSTGALGDTGLISREAHLASHHLDLKLRDKGLPDRTHGSQVAMFSLLSARIRYELTGEDVHGISWQQLRDAYNTAGTYVTAGQLKVSPAELIDAYVHAQRVRLERYTLLYDLYRIFNVPLKDVKIRETSWQWVVNRERELRDFMDNPGTRLISRQAEKVPKPKEEDEQFVIVKEFKVGELLRCVREQKLGADLSAHESTLVGKYGEGEQGLREFVTRMALDAGIIPNF